MLGFSALSARSICGQLGGVIPPPTPTPADTHDYPFPFVDDYRKRRKRQDKLLIEEEQAKLKANNIREEINKILYPQQEVEEEKITEPVQLEQKPLAVPDLTPKLLKKLADLEVKLALYNQEWMLAQEAARLEAIAIRQMKDEEDMKVILQLLEYPIKKFLH